MFNPRSMAFQRRYARGFSSRLACVDVVRSGAPRRIPLGGLFWECRIPGSMVASSRKCVAIGVVALGFGCGRLGYDDLPLVEADPDADVSLPDIDASTAPSPARLNMPPDDMTGNGVGDLMVFSSGAELAANGALWVFEGGNSFAPTSTVDRSAVILGTGACTLLDTARLLNIDSDAAAEMLVSMNCAGSKRIALIDAPLPATSDIDSYPQLTLPGDMTLSGYGEAGMGSAAFIGGDFDGDGVQDLIGSYMWQSEMHLYTNLASASGTLTAATVITSPASEALGTPMETIGADLTGDGIDDLLVPAHHAGVPAPDSGAVYVLAGPLPTGNHDVATLAYATIIGPHAGSEYGRAAVVDMNLDGVLDVVVASHRDNTAAANGGRVGVFFGPIVAGIYTASDADIHFSGDAGNRWGLRIDSHADLNGDGNPDLIFGSSSQIVGVYASESIASLGPSTVDFILTAGGVAIRDVAAVGDVNGDGADDFVASEDAAAGQTFVFSGRVTSGTFATQASATVTGVSPTESFGKRLFQR